MCQWDFLSFSEIPNPPPLTEIAQHSAIIRHTLNPKEVRPRGERKPHITGVCCWGSNGSGDGEFYYLSGIAVNATGYVYVVDENARVEMFDPTGHFVAKWG